MRVERKIIGFASGCGEEILIPASRTKKRGLCVSCAQTASSKRVP